MRARQITTWLFLSLFVVSTPGVFAHDDHGKRRQGRHEQRRNDRDERDDRDHERRHDRNDEHRDRRHGNRDDLFVGLDRNRNGVISRDEWRGSPALFDRLDLNHDGVLSRAEFKRGS